MGKGLFVNPELVVDPEPRLSRLWIEMTLEATLAFWIALRIETPYPPDTSVPRPTWNQTKFKFPQSNKGDGAIP